MIALGLGTVGAVVAPATAFADTYSMESQFVSAINAVRQSHGLSPYSVASDLMSIARGHSSAMASGQSLYHNPSLTTQVSNWQAVGENVGEGPSVTDLETAFVNSPEHYANMVDHDFTQIGVGVTVDKSGIIWVTEDFRQPMGSTGSTASSGTTQQAGTTGSSAAPSSYAAPSAPYVAPRPVLSPRQLLMHRLHDIRRHHRHQSRTGDPVAQAFHYVASLSRLTA